MTRKHGASSNNDVAICLLLGLAQAVTFGRAPTPQGALRGGGSLAEARQWVDTMKALKLNYEYVKSLGAGHIGVIEKGMPDLFAFFKEPSSRPDASYVRA